MFSTNVLRKIYALPVIRQEVFDSAHDENPSCNIPNSFTSQGNINDIQDEAADVEHENKKENAVEDEKDEEVDVAPVELDRWQGTGYTMPQKKKLRWRHCMMALFSSCCKAKNNTD